MRISYLALSALGCAALVLAAALVFRLPLERAAVLAPVIVATAGATAFVLVLWTKIAVESLRRQRHPLRIVAAGLAALALLVFLSFFVELPAGH
jgi:hypothetical protein